MLIKCKEIFNQHSKLIIMSSCLLINAALFAILIVWGNPIFATNDDYRMRLIVSGNYSGEPNNQAVFINIILSTLLSWLYKTIPSIEWYAIYFELGMFFSICVVDYICLKRTRTILSFIKKWFWILSITALALEKQILMPQFTTVSAFFAMAAIGCLIEVKMKQKYAEYDGICLYYGVALIFIIFSFCTRLYTFLLFFPVIIGVCFLHILDKKKTRKYTLLFMVGILVFCGSFRVAAVVNRNSSLMREYMEFNEARAKVTDYQGLPDYYSNIEFYEEIGMDEATYTALKGRTLDVSDSISTENFVKIKQYTSSQQEQTISKTLGASLNKLFETYFSSECRYTTLAILLSILLACKLMQREKDLMNNLLLCGMILYAVFTVLFFIIMGRIMARIVESIAIVFVGMCISLLGQYDMVANTPPMSFKDKVSNHINSITLSLLLILCIFANQYSLLRDETAIRHVITEKVEQLNFLKEYVQDNPDNFYFYNSLDFIASSDYLFENQDSIKLNMDSLGNWYAGSPLYKERNAQYGFETAIDGLLYHENVYYVEIGDFHACIEQILAQHDKVLEQIDSISNDEITINIYHCIDKN